MSPKERVISVFPYAVCANHCDAYRVWENGSKDATCIGEAGSAPAAWRNAADRLPCTPAESEEDILHEAFRLTGGDRQQDYGSPADNFACIARMWSALKPGVEFTASDVAMFQICVKLSREAHHSKRDNAVDMAGYARCLHICNEAAKAGQ